jgi:hydrogenase nickel incorporation protein HypA/HybF
MHELAICQALVDELAAVASTKRAASITDVYLSVGPLAGVERPLLASAFPVAAAGTVAGNATLHIELAALRVRCDDCGRDSDVTVNRLVCAHCGNWRTTLVSGDELLLQRVVLEAAESGEPVYV